MATHRRFVLQFNALAAIVLLLLPVCSIARPSTTSATDNGDTISASSSGFGYELLRSQLDEMQASISQLQQAADRRNECTGLDANIATILKRLETIENGLKASNVPVPPRERVTLQRNNDDEVNLETMISNARRRAMETHETFLNRANRARDIPASQPGIRQSIYDRVYDSCDDVPSSGVWKIREGRQITNVSCVKF